MISVDLNQQPLVYIWRPRWENSRVTGVLLNKKIGHFTRKKPFVDIPNTVFEIDLKSLILCRTTIDCEDQQI